ncbi:LAFA_0E11254g1_1 [Lachancea sp. 'fantastica']|nr:LAFA_0E11254g1_1 [Lachancea sp. 'fantastica']
MKDIQRDDSEFKPGSPPLATTLDAILREYRFPAYTDALSQQKWSLHSESALSNTLENQENAVYQNDSDPLWTPVDQPHDKSEMSWWQHQQRFSKKPSVLTTSAQFKKGFAHHLQQSSDAVAQSPAVMSSRANSLFSVMTESSKSDHSSPTTHKPTHRRSSAISLDKDCIRRSGIFKNPSRPLEWRSDRTTNVPHRRSGSSFSEAFKIITPSSEQLRRSSEPHFLTDFEQSRCANYSSAQAHANMSETTKASHPTISYDFFEPFSFTEQSNLQRSTPKEGQNFQSLLPPIEFSDLCSHEDDELPKKDDNELLSLKEFLESTQ